MVNKPPPQPLDQQQQIVVPGRGTPTLYFLKWAQERMGAIAAGITAQQCLDIINAYLEDHTLNAGSGIAISPSGNIADSPTIAAEVQAILDQISTTHGSILFRGAADWQALAPGTAGKVLSTNGAGADPSWITASGGGGVLPYVGQPRFRGNNGSVFSAGFWGGRFIVIPQNGHITAVVGYCSTANGASQVRPGIYAVNGSGNPAALVGTGSQITGVAFGVFTIPLTTPLAVSKGDCFWVGCQVLTSALTVAAVGDLTDTGFFAAAGALPNPGSALSGTLAGASFWPEMA